ncbi:MAG: FAD-dependent oxidoreductase [Oscillospiraceae bacterium]|nr:FAD-dependent oxidoreductase [Oscillospiraceae bacterium]
MSSQFQKLFEPLKIGNLHLKNRISMAPLGMVAMADPCGEFTKEAQEYYIERAKGGTGLIITGITNVNYQELKPLALPCAAYNPLMFSRSCAPMNERIHSYECKIFLQLTGGLGRAAIPGLMQTAIAPSAQENRWDPSIVHREMTKGEIEELISSFAACAKVAKQSNFDGVEVHAVHEGYLLDQFALSFYNKRTDEYGGDLKGRLKLATDIVQAIKNACGKEFPVSLRYSLKSFIKGLRQGALPGEMFQELGKDIEEGLEAAQILVEAGYDILNVDVGTYDSWYWSHPPMYFEKGMYREFGRILKQRVAAPIILAGRMDNPVTACEALGTCCDIVGYGRPLLADPYLPEKIQTDQLEEIRPCISCQQGCLDRLAHGLPLSCAVNPACGREKDMAILPTETPKNVLIVGGGLAGMEAARVCALRGHRVNLLERSSRLGGHIIPGGVPEFKKDDRALLRWYERQMKKLPIMVWKSCVATKEWIEKSNADVVIFATGSNPVQLYLGNKNQICTADQVLLGEKEAGNQVVILGGGLVGCETALWLLQKGKRVSIVETAPKILNGGEGICFANYDMLKDLLHFYKAEIFESAKVTAVKDDAVTVQTKEGTKELAADTVIQSVGYQSEDSLYQSMAGSEKVVYRIGDAREVRNIMHAVWDAYQLALEL